MPYGTDEFTTEADHFKEFGVYTKHPYGSPAYIRYWKEMARRSLEGYNIGRDWISGYNYFYLNFSPIQVAKVIKDEDLTNPKDMDSVIKQVRGERTTDFPDFWDGDYDYFHYLEEAEASGKHGCVLKTRGRGYQEPNSEPVLTPNGFIAMGELKTEDKIIGRDGKSATIKEVIPQGECDVYEVEFHDGRKVKCGLEHLWGVYNTKGNYRVVTTEYLLSQNLKQHPNSPKSSYSYKVPSVEEVHFKKKHTQKLEINPYLLGLLIGDGSTVVSPIKFSTKDQELVKWLQDFLKVGYTVFKYKWDKYGYTIKSKISNYNGLARGIKALGLDVKSYDKFIPEHYKYASVEERYELVKGLMDTDGTVSENGNCRFTSSSERLIDDLIWVLRSLGIRCKKAKTNLGGKLTEFPNGCKSIVRDSWVISITTYKQIFKLKRKADKLSKAIENRKLKHQDRIGIKNIKKLNYKEESTCIYIDNKDHLYLTTDFIPTHNSYKGGSMLNRNYFLIPKSKSYAFADDSEYLTNDGILTKAWDIMNFIDENTGWSKRRHYKNTDMHKKASYQKNKGGIKVEAGYKSEIIGVSLKNNWNKARGKRGKLILFEEAGKFPNLLKAWNIGQPSMQQGRVTFGLMVAFGTGGTEGADFMGLEELFYNGKGYDIHVIPNIWDKGAHNSTCGFFMDEATNLEGFMDKDGNSKKIEATQALLKLREKKRKETSDEEAYTRYVAERPLTPQEATMRISGSIFPVNLLKEQLAEIQPNIEKYKALEWVGRLEIHPETGEVEWKLDSSVKPIYEYPLKNDGKGKFKSLDGGIIIYEHPFTNSKDIPSGTYIAGIDPYDHDESTTDSLGSTWVMNLLTGRLVAEYTGRPATAREYYENVRRLLRYYNARANYENNVKGVLTDFENHRASYLLADTPRIVADMIDDRRTLSRRKGTPASESINKAARESYKAWLLEPAVGKEEGVLNAHTIRSIPLLKESIYWNKDINCDRVSAIGMLMLYRDDLLRGKLSDKGRAKKLTGSQKIAQSKYWDKFKTNNKKKIFGNHEFNL